MRDSNWSPDFRETGARIAWFLDKEIDVNTDGVIAVDVAFVKYLLETVGPVKLPDYQTTVTSDNLYTEAQTAAEADFFPGSTKKRDFLGSLGRALLTKLVTEENILDGKLAINLFKSLKERHLLVYFTNPTLEDEVSMFGWSGQLTLPKNCDDNCLSDFIQVVDANLGVNKVNYYINRKIQDEVVFSADKLEHTTRITFKNTSPNSSKWGGDYKNYARVFVPMDAELISARVEDLSLTLTAGGVATDSTASSGFESGWRVFSSWLTISPNEEKTLTFVYTRPIVDISQALKYVYKIQKQPGTKNDDFQLTIKHPVGWQMARETSSGEVAGATTLANDGKNTYNSSLSEDILYIFNIGQ